MSDLLPLSIRDVSPSPDAIRLTGIRPDGLPDGFHTGGAWLVGDTVFKPLDGRPYANCEGHAPTKEAECLEEMAGKPCFPRNWHIKEINGRRFLVRQKALTIPGDIPYSHLNLKWLLYIEAAVRDLNRTGWEINDPISLAIDPDGYEPFILDLSAANKMPNVGCCMADEEWRIIKLFEACKADLLVKLRQNAQHAISSIKWQLENNHRDLHHVYGSFNRPMSDMWATIPGEHTYIHNPDPNWTESQPHTWLVTKDPLPQDVIDRYELRWGWSPIHPQ